MEVDSTVDVIGGLAATLCVCVFCVALVEARRLWRSKDSAAAVRVAVDVKPFYAQLVNCTTWLGYGLQVHSMALLFANAFGAFSAATYMCVYYWCLKDFDERQNTWAQIVIVVFCSIAAACGSVVAPAFAVGAVGSAMTIAMFAVPFRDIYRSGTTVHVSIALCGVGICNAALWSVYGWMRADIFIVGPNAVNVLLTSVLLALWYAENKLHVGLPLVGAPSRSAKNMV